MHARLIALSATATAAVALATLMTGITSVAARQLKTPADWKWRLDAANGVVVDREPKTHVETYFVTMAPGWHVTTGTGALLYHPDHQVKANFAVEAEVFLFPGKSQEEYGIFAGGRGFDATEMPAYIAFVARRDGQGAILRRGGPAVVDWTANTAIAPHPGTDDTVKNVLRVDAGPVDVVFTANGKEVARIPRAGLALDGYVGFRAGRNMNLHASRLDITHKLAPVPVKK